LARNFSFATPFCPSPQRHRFGLRRGLPDAFCLTVDHLEIEDTYALKLMAFLRAHQGPGALFMCANGLAERFGWTRERLSAARRLLIELGHPEPVRQAGRGPAIPVAGGRKRQKTLKSSSSPASTARDRCRCAC